MDPQGFTRIDLWVNRGDLLPEQLKVVEESGDELTLRLTSLTLNPALDDALFEPTESIPPGTDFRTPARR